MKYLKTKIKEFNTWKICKKYGIENWKIRDGLIDVDGSVYLDFQDLDYLPLNFGTISGNFECQRGYLKSLKGSPKIVGDHFNCRNNELTTLEGGPKWIGGYFSCDNNQLTTLEHFPNVKGDINIDNNPLPKEIYDNEKYLKQIIELQDEYDIWRDGKLYLPRFRELLKDIN